MSMAREPSLPPSPVGRLLDGFFLPLPSLFAPLPEAGITLASLLMYPYTRYRGSPLMYGVYPVSSFGLTFRYEVF